MEDSVSAVFSPAEIKRLALMIACHNGTKVDIDWEKVATIGGYKDAASAKGYFNQIRRLKFVKLFGTMGSTPSKVAAESKAQAAGARRQRKASSVSVAKSVEKGKKGKLNRAIDYDNHDTTTMAAEKVIQSELEKGDAQTVKDEFLEEFLAAA